MTSHASLSAAPDLHAEPDLHALRAEIRATALRLRAVSRSLLAPRRPWPLRHLRGGLWGIGAGASRVD